MGNPFNYAIAFQGSQAPANNNSLLDQPRQKIFYVVMRQTRLHNLYTFHVTLQLPS